MTVNQKEQKNVPFYERKIRRDPQKMHHAHFHEKNELYYLEKGTTKYFIGNEIFLLEAGDMIFVPKNTFHKTDNSTDAGVERVLFTFDDGIVGADGQKYLELLRREKLIRLQNEPRNEVQRILASIAAEDERRAADYVEMEQLYFRQLLILIARHLVPSEQPALTPTYLLIHNVAKYVSEHVDADLSLPTLSRKYAVSASYLSRTFRAVTGVGLNEYVNVSRISRAELLLREPGAGITDVAVRCGFNDSNYFAAVFKKLKGVTPKRYALMHERR